MNEADIRKFAQLMKELELTGLEITKDDQVVRLERAAAPAVSVPLPQSAPAPVVAPAAAAQADEGLVCVRSPMVGLFYAAPAEDAEPYVTPGDRVKKGQTLCILEAMKLMNELKSEYDGIIEQILVTNGQMVEYGTPLMRVRRA